ncbi:hypothetical protein BN1708_002255 [Verticillium longisporum]|uniref:Aminotransferase class I/classII domain-containing protein n=1 Tax=Verticillium longisporum TaxID=100787 RepID=A0A0G4KLI2_VERLO|nr:hypothetical protein BN1708_002255 [Verticillium longisporum]
MATVSSSATRQSLAVLVRLRHDPGVAFAGHVRLAAASRRSLCLAHSRLQDTPRSSTQIAPPRRAHHQQPPSTLPFESRSNSNQQQPFRQQRRVMSTKPGPRLNAQNINPNVVAAQYAVRGELAVKSEEYRAKLAKGDKDLPFDQAAAKEGRKADEFYCLRLLEATGICVVPGSGFGQKEGTLHFRTTFLAPGTEWVGRIVDFHKKFMDEFR